MQPYINFNIIKQFKQFLTDNLNNESAKDIVNYILLLKDLYMKFYKI